MATNAIEIFKNDSKTVIATVSGLDTLSGYTSIFTMKDNFDDAVALISNTGTTDGLTVTFELVPAETNVTADNYRYAVTHINSSLGKRYTSISNVVTIKDTVRED